MPRVASKKQPSLLLASGGALDASKPPPHSSAATLSSKRQKRQAAAAPPNDACVDASSISPAFLPSSCDSASDDTDAQSSSMCASQATTSAAVFRSRRLQSSGTPECDLETPIQSCCDAPAETPALLSPCTPTPSLASECQCPVSALHSHVVASAREPAIRRCLDPPLSSTGPVRDLVAAYGETNLSTCNLTVLSMSALNQLSAHPSCRHFLDATQVSYEDLQRYFQTITNPIYIKAVRYLIIFIFLYFHNILPDHP